MAAKKILTAERLRELLHYDPATGKFTRIKSVCGVGPNRRLGWIRYDGRLMIGVDRVQYFASRLAWLWMTGEWPKFEVDHINRDPSDDRWLNLRDETRQQNERNKGVMKTNTSGVTGVSYSKRDKVWVVHVSYRSKEEAIRVAKLLRRIR